MTVEKKTNYGSITVSEEAVASLAGGVITECYGVIGMASKKVVKDGLAEMLKKENYTKGVVVRRTGEGLEIDLFIIVSFGVKISEVVAEAQKKVKYVLEKSLSEEIAAVNVFVQGVQVLE
ncbi:MAG: Asp23/Gls24 family envelope stress response protein [Solobacterium sp.]|nr:Asp23/Gls24 family envelope stress response protein [Solobacterium sp.]MBQ6223498.1 Asp23/Gls24 family envelope stress response protein [Solobacterium sp.]MBR2669920.1 Asp23/Gls24 family envelope stress response protein [Solobacterium sp.]